MVKYVEVKIQIDASDQRDLLIAELAESGFEGFEENGASLFAYTAENNFDQQVLKAMLLRYQTPYSVSTIEQQNWNEVWESNFEPVQIDDFCIIRANFHAPQSGFRYEIIITPKMSFGTGHHATTWLMIEAIKGIDCGGKRVLDFGTGTGVLAILSEKMWAAAIDAIDIDDWSIANAKENIAVNHAEKISLYQAGFIDLPARYDIILANINKNVILKSLPAIKNHLAAEGTVLLSGLLKEDREEVVQAATSTGLILLHVTERNSWICLKFGFSKDLLT